MSLPMKVVLEKMSDYQKKDIACRIRRVLGPEFSASDMTGTMKEVLHKVFETIGKATYRLKNLKDIQTVIADYTGNRFTVPTEIVEMRDNLNRQVETCIEFVNSYFQDKEKQQIPANPA